MKKIAIIKTGDTFPAISSELSDFQHWIISGLKVPQKCVQVIDVPRGDNLPDREDCRGVVIAGSHAMVTENLSWSVSIEKWVPGLVKSNVPVLGICYGHQLLARAMGGKVDFHKKGIEIGTVGVDCLTTSYLDPLFKGLPERFDVHACHSQTVVKLPAKAILLASNDCEPHHAFRIGTSAWGVQFHPEYDPTIMKAYIDNMAEQIISARKKVKDLKAAVTDTPVAAKILKRFGKLACG